MQNWRIWWASYACTLAVGGALSWRLASDAGWLHPAIADGMALAVLTLPFGIYRWIESRKARSYARLLARVR